GRVRSQMHAYCDFAVANPGHYRLMLGAGPHRPRAGERTGPLVEVIDALAVGFGHCERAGHPLRVDSERAALLVFVGVHGRVSLLHSNYSPENARSAKAFVDELFSLVFV
ncbi:MAG: TetR-like C-terminal domain-containing protein, partial [Mycobacteriales bacterium]